VHFNVAVFPAIKLMTSLQDPKSKGGSAGRLVDFPSYLVGRNGPPATGPIAEGTASNFGLNCSEFWAKMGIAGAFDQVAASAWIWLCCKGNER